MADPSEESASVVAAREMQAVLQQQGGNSDDLADGTATAALKDEPKQGNNSRSLRMSLRKSARRSVQIVEDQPSEFLPAIPPEVTAQIQPGDDVREFARRSLARAGAPPPPPGSNRSSLRSNLNELYAPIVVANPDDPNEDAGVPTETYYVDAETGKAMVTRTTTHKGRPASVTVEVNPDGHIVGVVSGTARLPGESKREYLRKMSSFASWQLYEKPGTLGISWNGDQKYPYFSYLVILVTGILLIIEIAINGGIEPFAINPTFGPKREILVKLGAKRTDLIVHEGQFHRLIAAWWLHGGILHWVMNMLALVNLGFSLEREFGTPKIFIIFCTCGFMGALCSAVFLPEVVGVGASGAIFGLFGSCFSDIIQNWGLYKSRGTARMTLCQLVFGAILNFLLGLVPMLDQFAHLGGFLTGVSLGFVFLLQRRFTRFGEEKMFKRRQRALQLCGAITVPLGIIVLLIVLYQGVNVDGWCDWCGYINCVPIPNLWTCDDSGCSDDPAVQAIPFPNSTLMVNCPSSTNGRVVYTTIDYEPTLKDVIAVCQELCFV